MHVERIYNASGQLTLSKEFNKYNGSIMVWRYIYDDRGILEKEIYYLDDVFGFARIYKSN